MRKIKGLNDVKVGDILMIDRRKDLVNHNGSSYLGNILVYQIFIPTENKPVSLQERIDGTIKYCFIGDSYKLQTSKIIKRELLLAEARLILKRESGFKSLTEEKFKQFDVYRLNKNESGKVAAKIMLFKLSK